MSLPVQPSTAPSHSSQAPYNGYLYKFFSSSKEFRDLWKSHAIDPWLYHVEALQAGILGPKGKCLKKFIELSREIEQDPFRKDGLQLLLIFRELDYNDDLASKIPLVAFQINEHYWDDCMGERLKGIYEDCPYILNPEIRLKYNLGELEMLVLLSFFWHVRVVSLDDNVAEKLLYLIGR